MNQAITEPYQLFFETLGNKARWDIVHLLMKRPERATSIAKRLELEQSLASHHLRRLETCGFVHVTERGTERIYRLNTVTIKPLLKIMGKHINVYCKHVFNHRHMDNHPIH